MMPAVKEYKEWYIYQYGEDDFVIKGLSEILYSSIEECERAIDVFEGVGKLLWYHGFVADVSLKKWVRRETGCEFSFRSICEYKSVLDFQLDFPHYSIY